MFKNNSLVQISNRYRQVFEYLNVPADAIGKQSLEHGFEGGALRLPMHQASKNCKAAGAAWTDACFTSQDVLSRRLHYIHASAHLNTMVYQHPERRGKTLPWKLRTRLMCKLLAGDMGIDVLHAMRPQFELRTDIGEIPDDLVKEFKKTSALRTWGWMCIIDGTPQVVPPVALL